VFEIEIPREGSIDQRQSRVKGRDSGKSFFDSIILHSGSDGPVTGGQGANDENHQKRTLRPNTKRG
jgi:hypothetical protein